jgi:hypothetical protein
VIATFTLRPTKVKGGANAIAEIQLLPSVTSPQTVALSTDRPDVIQLPSTVSVAASAVPTPFTITTHDVNQKIIVTITATAGTQSIPLSLTNFRIVNPVHLVGHRKQSLGEELQFLDMD